MSQDLKWNDLFPTPWSFFIFIGYMALFINQGLLVTASQNSDKGYSYNTVTAVLLTEVLKLIISLVLLFYRRPPGLENTELDKIYRVFMLYLIPAGLYCLYNNLSYKNLATFDPTTYFILLQLRVVVTGICFQVLFKKYLSTHQWCSLILLTFGCVIKELNFSPSTEPKLIYDSSEAEGSQFYSLGLILILVQVISSSAAGVFNEFLLKNAGANVPVLLQNVCLYLDSIFWNIIALSYQGNLLEGLNYESILTIFTTPAYLAVVLNNAAIGIVTSFFLAQMNSILKTFASALELMFTAVLCWIVFGMPITFNTVIAIIVVSVAIYMYSLQPVVHRSKVANGSSQEDPLLPQKV